MKNDTPEQSDALDTNAVLDGQPVQGAWIEPDVFAVSAADVPENTTNLVLFVQGQAYRASAAPQGELVHLTTTPL